MARSLLTVAICALALLTGAVDANARQPLAAEGPVELSAEQLSYDAQSGQYRALGKVEIRRGELTLLADEVLWHPASGEARAKGQVELHDPRGTVRGESLELNVESGTGRLSEGHIFLRDGNLHVRGREIERLGPESYRLGEGLLTTCDGAAPAWSFSARDMQVDVGGYARGRHARFNVRDVPLLYSPYILFPAKRERESGLLLPRYGRSSERGWIFSGAYYQVIADNQDATLYLDYFSEVGLGKGLEYRYALDVDSGGEAKVYHIADRRDDSDHLAVFWRHQSFALDEVRLGADIEYVSERDYFRKFEEDAGEYNKGTTESRLFATHQGRNHVLGAQLKYLQDLERRDDTLVQRLPELRFALLRQRIGESSLSRRLDLGYAHLWREQGQRGHRLSLRPSLAAAWQLGDWLELAPEVGYTQRFYNVEGGPEGTSTQGHGVADASLRLSSALARVYEVGGESVSRIRHLLSPDVTYSYVPPSEQGSLPFFDRDDRRQRRSRISYGLTNRLVARLESPRGEPHFHEFLYLRLSQDYDLDGSPPSELVPREQRRSLSELRTELRLRPTRASYLHLDSRYEFQRVAQQSPGFIALSADAGLQDRRGNGLGLGYHYLRDELEYLAATATTSLLDPVYLGYGQRYDLAGGEFLEHHVSLEYRAQCWSLFVSLRDRPGETTFLVSFALTGLGRVAHFGGSLADSW